MPLSILSCLTNNRNVFYKNAVRIPLITATGITITSNTANYPDTTNYKYYVVSTGTGTITFSKPVTVQVFAAAGGGGGGGNQVDFVGSTNGAGGGGGSGAFYFNNSITMNTSTITVTVGSGGVGGIGYQSSQGGKGGTGGTTTIQGGSFPATITLNGGEGGYGGSIYSTNTTTFSTAVGFGGLGGTHTNGTYAGVSGGNGGRPTSFPSDRGYAVSTASNNTLYGLNSSPWAGSVIIDNNRNVISLILGDRAAFSYCASGPGGNGLYKPSNGSNPGNTPSEGGGGTGGNGTTAIRNGVNGGDGTIIFAVPIDAFNT